MLLSISFLSDKVVRNINQFKGRTIIFFGGIKSWNLLLQSPASIEMGRGSFGVVGCYKNVTNAGLQVSFRDMKSEMILLPKNWM